MCGRLERLKERLTPEVIVAQRSPATERSCRQVAPKKEDDDVKLHAQAHSRKAVLSNDPLGCLRLPLALKRPEHQLVHHECLGKECIVSLNDHYWCPRGMGLRVLVLVCAGMIITLPTVYGQVADRGSLMEQLLSGDRHKIEDAAAMIGYSGAVEILIGILKEPDSKRRHSAGIALCEMSDPRAVESLISALKDSNLSVRGSAACAMRKFADARLASPLIIAVQVESDDGVRRSASSALRKQPNAVEALITALNNSQSSSRSRVADELGGFNDFRAADALIAALADSDPDVRCSAAQSLGSIKDPRAVKPLVKVLSDPAADVDAWPSVPVGSRPLKGSCGLKAYAAQALGSIGDRSAVEPLIREMSKGGPSMESIVDALGKLGDPRAVDPLMAFVARDKCGTDYELNSFAGGKCYAVKKALGHIGAPAVEKLLEKLRNKEFRAGAASMLIEIDANRGREAIMTLLKEDDPETIASIYLSIFSLGLPGSEGPLIKALNRHGDTRMAERFLNSGKQNLREAALIWAKAHNFQITKGWSPNFTGWGSTR